jgi:threonyl-tRNA synthetase
LSRAIWLAPMQVEIIPVSDDCMEYAKAFCEQLAAQDVRAEIDDSLATVNYRIRNAELARTGH